MIVTFLRANWYIWLTNWSFIFVTLYFVCATIVTAIHFKKDRKLRARENNANGQNKNDEGHLVSKEKSADTTDSNKNPDNTCDNLGTRHVCDDGEVAPFSVDTPEASQAIPMAWFHEALWVIYNIAAVAAILVTLAFWTLTGPNNGVRAFTVIYHGVNAIFMVGDTMLSSVPVRLFHAIYPMLYCIAYIIFTVIHWASGGAYIYPLTDYTGRPLFSAVSHLCLFFIGIPLFQTMLFGLYRLRVWMKTKCGT